MINNINYLVTSRCNSRCTNCNMWNTKPLPELSPDQICTLFSLKEFQEVKEVGLSGGEPFIRQDMPEILEAIHRANPAIETIYITTNASFPSRVLEVCEVALKYFRNINIGVSIDGSKHVNRLIRGVDSYDSAYSLLQDLKYRYPQIHASISFTVCRANCSSEELMHIKTIAEELCCDYSFRIASEGESYYKNSGYNFSLTDEQRKMLIQFIIENKLDDKFMKEQLYYLVTGKVPLLYDYQEKKGKCPAGRVFVFIYSNGDMYPCLYGDKRIGDYVHGLYKGAIPNTMNCPQCPCMTECTIWPTIIYQEKKDDNRKQE